MFSLADDGLASILCNTSIYSYFVGNTKQVIEGCKCFCVKQGKEKYAILWITSQQTEVCRSYYLSMNELFSLCL